MSILERVRERALQVWEQEGMLDKNVRVSVGPLTVEQAIGTPEGTDFPIQKGRERLMEAGIGDTDQDLARGQAFTDLYSPHTGTLGDIAALPLIDNRNRAVFIAAMNASLRSLGRIGNTVHCRDQGPGQCSAALPEYLRRAYGDPRITLVGFQPAMIEAVNSAFPLRVLDLDPDNVNQVKRGVLVEGPEARDEALDWAQMLLVTGTTLVNDTLGRFMDPSGKAKGGKPVLLYGTTIAGAAELMGWDRYCPCSN